MLNLNPYLPIIKSSPSKMSEEEIDILSSNPFESPAEVPKEDLLAIVGSHENLRNEIDGLRAEINAKDSDGSASEDESFSTTLVECDMSFSPPMSNFSCNTVSKNTALIPKVEKLEEKWSKADVKLTKFLQRLNRLEQYGRLYNLLIHDLMGVPYKLKGFAFSKYVVRLLNNLFGKHLLYPITIHDIDKSHPLYRKANGKYVIIVRFVRRDVRDALFYKKHILARTNTGVSITENLTKDNMKLLKSAEDSFGQKSVLTDQGKIFALLHGKKRRIFDESSIKSLLNKFITIPVDSASPESAAKAPPHLPSKAPPVLSGSSLQNLDQEPAEPVAVHSPVPYFHSATATAARRKSRIAKNSKYLQKIHRFNATFNSNQNSSFVNSKKDTRSHFNHSFNPQWGPASKRTDYFNPTYWHGDRYRFNYRYPKLGQTHDYGHY